MMIDYTPAAQPMSGYRDSGSLIIIRSKRPNGEAAGFPVALPSARRFDSCLGSSAMIRGSCG